MYNNIYLGMDEETPVFIEDFVPGKFTKHVNNNRRIFRSGLEVSSKAEAFAHYTLDNFIGQLMVLDIQGVGYTLFDPEIVTVLEFTGEGDEAENLFCAGNCGKVGIEKFKNVHICN